MSVLILFLVVYSSALLESTSCSYMGSEQSLRQNIIDLYQRKLKFSDNTLPYEKDELSDTTPKNQSEYDFIIIGAGSAGSTIASRLSEIENITVLLIEAGGKEYSLMDIPSMAHVLRFSDEVDWNFQTESSDKFCMGMTNNQCIWPRGKVMGGSSVLNLMIATRGNRRDYDEWAVDSGDDSWAYANMLKYFKKLESFQVKDVAFDKEYHNQYGPMRITSSPRRNEFTDAFISAGEELGYPEVDYNGLEQRGFSYLQSTIYKGERWSANRAYLRPAKTRKNLIVTQHSHVHKILIDPVTKNAYGVRYTKNGEIFEVKARKEIILSAGAIGSPKILMLSGVGPAKHLQDLKINVIKDLPVGENLKDHIAYGGLIFKVNDSATYEEANILDTKNPTVRDYVNQKTGQLSLGMSDNGISFINVDDPFNLYPNLEMLFIDKLGIKHPVFALLAGIKENFRNQMIADKFNHSGWSIWPMLLRPRSSGKILLRSDNPFDKPMIYPNYLADPEDIRILIKGIRETIKLSKTRAFQKLGSELYDIPSSCQDKKKDSDEYWECLLRFYTITVYHYSGTCRMGQDTSNSSVVNSQLKVRIYKSNIIMSSIYHHVFFFNISGHWYK